MLLTNIAIECAVKCVITAGHMHTTSHNNTGPERDVMLVASACYPRPSPIAFNHSVRCQNVQHAE
jgi:hypothetical protein